MTNLKKTIAGLPKSPGVYKFYDKNNQLIYIGKATFLRDRVRSYFTGAHDNKTEQLVSQIQKIKFEKTDTVLEALILESNLIKNNQPKYNINAKDNKSFAYFLITKNEEYPRVLIVRKTDLGKYQSKKIYGPYLSKRQTEITLKILRKIFPFHSNKQKTEKGCLDFQLGRCPGPYSGAISKVNYLKNIRGIEMMLSGCKSSLIKKLENELRIKNHESRKIRIEAYDISNISGQYIVGSMIVFTDNKPDKSQYRRFKIKTVSGIDDISMIKEILERRLKNDWPKPNLILIDGGKGHLNAAQFIINKLRLDIPVVAVAKGPTRKKLDLYYTKNVHRHFEIISDIILLEKIRNEAHRFSIAYHRKRRRLEWLK
jgi:excinuclease ABC subunit C